MGWMLQTALLAVVGILLKRNLNWKQRYPIYILFFLVTGLFTTWISHILVLAGFLEFTNRPFPTITLNNPIYDLLFLPAVQLLFIQAAEKRKKLVWIFIFALALTVQDYLSVHYTNLLRFRTWTLGYTFFLGFLHFSAANWFYGWLQRVLINEEEKRTAG